MVVGAAGENLVATVHKFASHYAGVLLYLLLIFLEFGSQRLAKCHSLGSDYVLQRTALDAGEHRRIKELRHCFGNALGSFQAPRILEVLAQQDDAAARSTEGLVGGGCYDVDVFERVFEEACGDKTGGVSHIYHHKCAHLVGDGTHTLVVPIAGISRRAADDEFGLALQRHALHLVVVNETCLFVYVVGNVVVEFARRVDGRAVREVSAVVEVETHKGVAGLQHGGEHSHIGLCARVGLYVDPFGVVEFFETLDGDGLHLVHDAASAVETLAGQALGVLVGEDAAHSAHHIGTHEVLRRNEFDSVLLTVVFLVDKVKNFLIFFH